VAAGSGSLGPTAFRTEAPSFEEPEARSFERADPSSETGRASCASQGPSVLAQGKGGTASDSERAGMWMRDRCGRLHTLGVDLIDKYDSRMGLSQRKRGP
jgi:hypothetical protein